MILIGSIYNTCLTLKDREKWRVDSRRSVSDPCLRNPIHCSLFQPQGSASTMSSFPEEKVTVGRNYHENALTYSPVSVSPRDLQLSTLLKVAVLDVYLKLTGR